MKLWVGLPVILPSTFRLHPSGEALDRGDPRALGPLHRHQARAHGLAVLDDHTAAAVAVGAAVFDAGQAQIVAQHVHQVGLRRGADLALLAVDDQGICLLLGHSGSLSDLIWWGGVEVWGRGTAPPPHLHPTEDDQSENAL